MNKWISVLLAVISSVYLHAQSSNELLSPDGFIKVSWQAGSRFSYTITYKNQPLLLPSAVDMIIGNGTSLLSDAAVQKQSRKAVNTTIVPVVAEKRKLIPDVYNEVRLDFKQPVSLLIRAYNDGIAYRLVMKMRDSIIVKDEKAQFRFPPHVTVYYPQMTKREDADKFHTSFEENYKINPIDSIQSNSISFSPVLVSTAPARVLITESDLEDYPGMFITGNGADALEGIFAPYPLEERITGGNFPQAIVTKRADYIAKTNGNRPFPWRVIAIAAEDKSLPSNDIVYRLASPSRVKDVSWIKPGKATDEWIIGINLFNVPFKTGVNTASYKYYIDFAKRFGFDRIMMDAGWSDNTDLFKVVSEINMDTISAYAKSQGIHLSMWTLAWALNRQLDSALQQFKRWGVDFIMTDFIDRDDQKTVNFYYRVAKACADNHIMLMYHGAYKPAGFGRTFPNALTRESVLGSEYNVWSYRADPAHNLLLPFIRMVSGPMDYEPGILDNATQKTFRPVENKVMSLGTRCHQLAMFVVYDSPMQFFSGNPSQGWLEPRFMELLGSIPTTWDETLIPDAKLGEYIITARKRGDDWFIGGLTDWTERNLTLPLSFLSSGTYQLTICSDGVNAERFASDYTITEQEIKSSEPLLIKMAPGGGYMARLRKIK